MRRLGLLTQDLLHVVGKASELSFIQKPRYSLAGLHPEMLSSFGSTSMIHPQD